MIQERHTTLNGKIVVNKSSFNFSGQPVKAIEEYGTEISAQKSYRYDHMGRMIREVHTLGKDSTEFIYGYDFQDRIIRQTRIHGLDSLATDNRYNIRGWIEAIESPLFSQKLHYTDGKGTPCYNGNISSMTCKGNDKVTRGYKFTYDGVSRMTDATYGEGDLINANPNRFTEQVTGYDKNGNILGLKRYGQTGASSYGLIDNLALTLNGNQLKAVNDAVTTSVYNNGFEFKDGAKVATEYTYDTNGNLTKDLNKNIISIQYNMLNLPSIVSFSDGSTITYTYGADGTKLRTVHKIGSATTTTDYLGNVVYENGVAKLLLTGYGYVSLNDKKYHYFLQDYQGNNRVVVDSSGKVNETNHYYPFGGVFASTGNVQPYKYNGKELDAKKGLNWYDYGARMYDPALGRWHTVDPLAENYYRVALYVYCDNLPVLYIDPDGKGWNEAWPHLKNSVSGNISFGLNAGVSAQVLGVKIGAQINAGSVQYGSGGAKETSGVSVNVGIVGIESYDNAYELDSRTSVKENGLIVSVPLWSEDNKKTTTYDSTNKYYEKIDEDEISKSEVGNIDFSAAVGVGVAVEIDLKEVWNFFVNLFK